MIEQKIRKRQNIPHYTKWKTKQRSGPKNRGQKLPQSKCETLRKSTRSYRISKTWEYWAKCNRYANLITIIFKYCFINKKKSIFSLIS